MSCFSLNRTTIRLKTPHYLATATGYSRAQVTRLLHAYTTKGAVQYRPCTPNGFQSRFSKADIRLLAETDRLHNDLSGPALKKICTRRVQRTIGVRHRPDPQGRSGFIRIDTVHQGDKDGEKRLYHINAVDEMTQFEVICSVERISEMFLIAVLEKILTTFPFKLLEFHSGNGSEYINHRVCQAIEQASHCLHQVSIQT